MTSRRLAVVALAAVLPLGGFGTAFAALVGRRRGLVLRGDDT